MSKKIAILTNFKEFNPGYSLSGIVSDQCRMFTEHGHEVDVFVADSFRGHNPLNVPLKKVIPHPALTDYRSQKDLKEEDKEVIVRISAILQQELKDYDFVITHDWIFTGWNMIYALGMQDASPYLRLATKKRIKWAHWIHSVPTSKNDWWSIRHYGPGHKIIYPNRTDRVLVAEQYQGKVSDVRTVPHIKDLRSFMDFNEETCEFIKEFPGLMQHDVVQVYPASTDRLKAKQLRYVMLILAQMKKSGFSVFLLIANQWATGWKVKPPEEIQHYINVGRRNGLRYGVDFIFTSEWKEGKYSAGLPKHILREMMMCSNLFIYPTIEESFGLVGPEMALVAGGCLMVLNKSLPMMFEVNGGTGLYCDFGSFCQELQTKNTEREYMSALAMLFLGRMQQNEAINQKTFHRQNHNWDALYNRYYHPLTEESQVW